MQDPSTIYIPPGYGRISFGRVELKNIFVAVGALTLAFTIFLLGGLRSMVSGNVSLFDILYAAAVSLIAVLSGFMFHELAHKFVAQRSGAWAEFRAHPMGLLIGVVISLLGVIFVIPGAVYIQGMISRKQNGLISLAGPATNLALGGVFIALFMAAGQSLLGLGFYWIGMIHFLLAAFNMLPIPPLDGSKVLRWNVPAYVLVFGVSIIMVALMFTGALIRL